MVQNQGWLNIEANMKHSIDAIEESNFYWLNNGYTSSKYFKILKSLPSSPLLLK
jgi:hypothetical protein